MSCKTHGGHDHQHEAGCGHQAVQHDGHACYLHDGHMHHAHGDHHDEHSVAEGGVNATVCTPEHACKSHEATHQHDAACGHERVPHGDHVDFLVAGHLHHPHGAHCDDHGPLA